MNTQELSARLRATFAEELDDQARQGNEYLLALERSPTDVEQIRSLFRVMHTLKGAARAAGVKSVEGLCHTLETRLADLREGTRAASAGDIAALFAGLDELALAAAAMQTGRQAGVPITANESSPVDRRHVGPAELPIEPQRPNREAAARVAPERLDQLLGSSTQLLITSSAQVGLGSSLNDVAEIAAMAAGLARRVRRTVDRSRGMTPRAVADLASVDEALNTIRVRTAQLARDVTGVAESVSRHARELAAGVRDIRLRPFADAASTLPRVVRDVALTTGKEVRLEIHGDAVEADRAVLDEIQNALLHLVRNAIDHGIEAPAVRRSRGKPEEGVVRVSASLISDRISVTVADDGAGIDIASLRRLLADRGETVPTDDIGVARRLFSGGITTRAAAGAISGRAVGLDAARAAMERVRGSLDVRWVAGKGSSFTLEAPLSMSTVRTVLARVGAVAVAVPTAYVVRLLRTPMSAVRSVNGRAALLSANDAPIPLVSLAALMGPPLVARAAGEETIVAIHIAANGVELAIRVDQLLSEEELVVRPVRAQGRGAAPHVSGAALLPTGEIALVLNVPQLLSSGIGATELMSANLVASAPAERRHRILVADDSITTRTLESSVLEAAGFEVITAVDGADAWRLLEARGADLVVSDVEMPRMDGVQLCATMRKSSRFKTTPVILVTALETSADRSRGLEAGADAYLAKSSFDQEGLLDTVHQLIGPPGHAA